MFENTPHHSQYQYRNQTLLWHSTDTEELYNKNLKDKKQYQTLFENGWVDADITYKFNEYGFRAESFNSKAPDGLVVGCSYTAGEGLPLDNIYTTYVSRKMGINLYNLGVCGASNGLMFRLVRYWLPILKPKFVIVQTTHAHRFELINQDNHSGIISPANQTITHGDLFKNWWYNDLNSLVDKDRNTLAIRYVCHELDIPLFLIDVEDFRNPAQGLARDLLHSGPRSHQTVAQNLIEKLKNFSRVNTV